MGKTKRQRALDAIEWVLAHVGYTPKSEDEIILEVRSYLFLEQIFLHPFEVEAEVTDEGQVCVTVISEEFEESVSAARSY